MLFFPNTVTILLISLSFGNSLQECNPRRFQRATITYTEKGVRRVVILKYGLNDLRYADKIEVFPQKVDQLCQDTFNDLFNLKTVILSGLGLKYIEPGAFAHLPAFTTLDLSNNNLEEIIPEVFKDLTLVNLYLANNKIWKLHTNCFNGMDNLRHLHLQYNKLKIIEFGVFNSFTANTIRLDNNEIVHIANDSFDDIKIEQLILSWNNLKYYRPEWFNNSQHFGVLNLANNHITKLPKHAFKNLNGTKYLVDIRLDDNGLKYIDPEAFSNGPRYRFVTLSNNNISDIPEDVFKGTYAGDVNWESNLLTCLPSNMKHILVGTHMNYLDNNPWKVKCREEIIAYSRKNKLNVSIDGAYF